MDLQSLTVQGERWFPSTKVFNDDKERYWGDWYCDSEVGKLRAVLMRRPGSELELIKDYTAVRFKSPIDPVKAREQHDALAALYRSHGVEVHYIEGYRQDRPNSLYVRDQVLMTPEGAIVCRPAMDARRGEERFAAEKLATLGVPIIKTINGEGVFEGACCLWINKETVILGGGCRANEAGLRQVKNELREIGVKKVIDFMIPYGHDHLDGPMNIADKKTAIVFPWQVPFDVCRELMNLGFKIIESPDIYETKETFATNFVALEPGKIVLPAGNPKTKEVLEDNGIECIEIDMSEIMKGWGAIHCMTAFLKRDPV